MNERFDIIVAGGGLAGAALALGLRSSGLKVALLEARPAGVAVTDNRTIALSFGSRLILERLGLWPELARVATAIHHIRISQQRGFGTIELHAQSARVPALGYVSPYSTLQRTMSAALEQSPVSVLRGCVAQAIEGATHHVSVTVDRDGACDRLEARLVAIADGGASLNVAHIKTRDYHQSAIVCDVVSEQSHQNRAFERFTPHGPLALLPTAVGWSLIWTLQRGQAPQLARLGDAEFCARLRTEFGAALGRFSDPTQRLVFPLALKYATRPVAARTVLIGNASQTLHPVAGQGFNLSLRDAWELTRALLREPQRDPGSNTLLNAYFSQRRYDRIATILFTDTLIRLFSNDIPFLSGARGLGLIALGATPSMKNFFTRRMMFGARG